MNRYALFFMLVSVQTNIVLSNDLQAQNEKIDMIKTLLEHKVNFVYYKHPEETKIANDESAKQIDTILGDKLNEQDAAKLKAVCGNHIRETFNKFASINNKTMKKAPKEETDICLEAFIEAKVFDKFIKDGKDTNSAREEAQLTAKTLRYNKWTIPYYGRLKLVYNDSHITEGIFMHAEDLCSKAREYARQERKYSNEIVLEVITKKFDSFIDNLNVYELKHAIALKHEWRDHLQEFLNEHPYSSSSGKRKKIETEATNYIIGYMQAALHRLLDEKECQQIVNYFKNSNLSSTFDNPVKKEWIEKAKEFCAQHSNNRSKNTEEQ